MRRYGDFCFWLLFALANAKIVLRNEVQYYLNPSLDWLLWLAAGMGLLMAFGTLPRHGYKGHRGAWWLLPLPILLLVMPGHYLSAPVLARAQNSAPLADTLVYVKPGPRPDHVDIDLTKEDDFVKFYSSYNGNPETEKLLGKTVSLRGMYRPLGKERPKLATVGRYLVTCCTAHAQLEGFFMEFPGRPRLKRDEWVNVYGYFGKIRTPQGRFTSIVITSWESCPPENPYFYIKPPKGEKNGL